MLPDSVNYKALSNTEIESQTSVTYKLDRENKRILTVYDDYAETIRQAVYLILLTERYDYVMYSWNYGVELKELFGREKQYVVPMLMQRIKEALTQDERILNVTNFEFEINRGDYSVSFTVVTKYADVDIEGVTLSV